MRQVLIVDDNATNLTLFRHLLKKIEDIEPVCFSDPLDAITWCESHEPNLVLLDYMMPGMDGLAFILRFKTIFEHQTIPIIMVTADTESDVRNQALNLGAYDFLNKPVDKLELLARVRNLLALRESQRALSDRAAWLASEVKKATADIRAREREMVLRLSKAAEHRDPETGQHLLRMANYSRLIAAELGLSPDEQEIILDAAPMHDIGKVATPDAVLLKPGKLTESEFLVMKQHAENGYTILSDSESRLIAVAATMALTHHEKFDGSGYPKGLKGEDIPLYGRIVAVADVFDALTSPRPYKRAWTLEEASQFLKENSGSHFDPQCVEAFFNVWDAVLAIHARYQDVPVEIDLLVHH
ncbi:MAG TPA: two-component system response regulator [Methylococcaceae bacterium]|nr:two-component system response regulator [Methylococcaceae bacterium]